MRIPSACILAGGMLSFGCGSELDLRNRTFIETFSQRPNDEVDILFVVDDSHSMTEEQEALAEGFSQFIGQLEAANAKFHLGVISTSQDTDDPERGLLLGDPPVLTAEHDYEALFRERVTVGTGGSDKEQGLQAAALAVEDPGNEGFLRDEAHLLVVFVSDEDDCSHDGTLDGLDSLRCYEDQHMLISPLSAVTRLWQAKGDPTQVSIGAIIAPEERTCEDGWFGSRYVEAVRLTGGLLGDVCAPSWASMLHDLGLTATGVYTQFELTHGADPATLRVTVDETEIFEDPEHGWTYDAALWRLELHGEAVPPRGSVLTVEYTVLPGDRTTE